VLHGAAGDLPVQRHLHAVRRHIRGLCRYDQCIRERDSDGGSGSPEARESAPESPGEIETFGGKLGPREPGEEEEKEGDGERRGVKSGSLLFPAGRGEAKVSYAYNAGKMKSFGAFFFRNTVKNYGSGHSQER
jgi:hypothetical protein